MPDLDLRLVRYFTVVAEHEHFGRAAEALRVAQPSLSRQIRRLESQVGVALLDRTPRGSRLTPAGRAFLDRARSLLREADVATAAARGAAAPTSLVVGFTGNLLVTPAVREVRSTHPGATVTTRHLEWCDGDAALLDHRVDVLVERTLPIGTDGLETHLLHEEQRVLVVPLDHRLAGKESITVDDLAGEVMVQVADPALDAFWRVLPRPDGSTPPSGPVVADPEDKFEHVAVGDAVTLAPASVRTHLRPDLTTVPVEGLAPLRVVVAHRTGDRSPLVRAFRAAAEAHLGAPRD